MISLGDVQQVWKFSTRESKLPLKQEISNYFKPRSCHIGLRIVMEDDEVSGFELQSPFQEGTRRQSIIPDFSIVRTVR